MSRMIFPACLLVLAACADNDPGTYEDAAPPDRTAHIWVDADDAIPPDTVLEACEAWRSEGVLCEFAEDPSEADIHFIVDDSPCVGDETGFYPLGRSSPGGDVLLFTACLHQFGGDPIDRDLLFPVVAHEVGHELGLWFHVPEDCDVLPEDANSQVLFYFGICGKALMNPITHRGLLGITDLDHAAFGFRDEDNSVLKVAPDGLDVPDCVLGVRE